MLRTIFRKLIWEPKEQRAFLIFVAFIVTIAVMRGIVYGVEKEIWMNIPFIFKYVTIKGLHIHHFVFGIILLIGSGLASFLPSLKEYERFRAIIFGVGFGMVIDEFGIVVTLEEAYWVRLSRDAIVASIILFINIIYAHSLWKKIAKTLFQFLRKKINQ